MNDVCEVIEKRTTKLRKMLTVDETKFILEAHNGLSAKIVQEAGFEGIWASGLSLSAAQGVRDNNELSWTQVVDIVEYMNEATDIPILLDGDTGYGNFNNFRRLVSKLENIGVAGVCIEDKLFPKTNSFLRGEAQVLADIDEFCGKIKAGKDHLKDDDFVIVARVESLIAGLGLKETLKRAEAYRIAGADAILIHSKKSTADEIFEFLDHWDNRHPVVIVPTKYYSTPTEEFVKRKVSLVIWANHLLRSSITMMQKTAKTIHEQQSLSSIEDDIVPVSEVFRLQGDSELEEAEKKYFKQQQVNEVSAIILAATKGNLGQVTEEKPKTLIKIGEDTILEKQIKHYKSFGVKNIKVVAGFGHTLVAKIHPVIVNNEYETTGQCVSLLKGMSALQGATVVSFGDILFKKYILQRLLAHEEDIIIVVDSTLELQRKDKPSDFINASQLDQPFIDNDPLLKRMSFTKPSQDYDGEWIGMMKLSEKGVEIVKQYLEQKESSLSQLNIPDMFNDLIEQGQKIHILYIKGHWIDVDDVLDLDLAHNF